MERVRFLHVPKVGGSTLSLMLSIQFMGQPKFSFSGQQAVDRKRFYTLTRGERESIRWFDGHAPYYTGISQADENVKIITMLRDPIQRVISFCQHVSEGKSPLAIAGGEVDDFDLDEFLESGNAELHNLQTKMLINTGDSATQTYLAKMGPEHAIIRARENLFEGVAAFGIQEYFDESVIVFQRQLDLSTPVFSLRNKKHRQRHLVVESRHIERIAEQNQLDLELYADAKRCFLDRLEANGPDRADVRRFRRKRAVVAPFIDVGLRARTAAKSRTSSRERSKQS